MLWLPGSFGDMQQLWTMAWMLSERSRQLVLRTMRRHSLDALQWGCSFLGWHVCRAKLARNIFSRREFSHEKCSEIFPEIFEPLFCGSEKKSRKIPAKIPGKLPSQKSKKKITDERSAGRIDGVGHGRGQSVSTRFHRIWSKSG